MTETQHKKSKWKRVKKNNSDNPEISLESNKQIEVSKVIENPIPITSEKSIDNIERTINSDIPKRIILKIKDKSPEALIDNNQIVSPKDESLINSQKDQIKNKKKNKKKNTKINPENQSVQENVKIEKANPIEIKSDVIKSSEEVNINIETDSNKVSKNFNKNKKNFKKFNKKANLDVPILDENIIRNNELNLLDSNKTLDNKENTTTIITSEDFEKKESKFKNKKFQKNKKKANLVVNQDVKIQEESILLETVNNESVPNNNISENSEIIGSKESKFKNKKFQKNKKKANLLVNQDVKIQEESISLETVKDDIVKIENITENSEIIETKENKFKNKKIQKQKNKKKPNLSLSTEIKIQDNPEVLKTDDNDVKLITDANSNKSNVTLENNKSQIKNQRVNDIKAIINQNKKNKQLNLIETPKTEDKSAIIQKSKVIPPKPQKKLFEKFVEGSIPLVTVSDLAKNPKMKELFERIMNFLENDLSVLDGSKILLGVSGGIDSVVLLDVIYNLSRKYAYKVYVMHFNHLLRGKESDDDQKFVEALCKKYNIQFLSASGNVKENAINKGLSIENSAREMRYEFFQRKAQSLSADYVATAHHSNDNAETFLINLFRGSGLTGLTGIPYKREIMKNTLLIRPLIKLTKDEINEYASFRKLEWRDDSSNQFSHFTRNKIRLSLIKEIEANYCHNFSEIITRTTEILKTADSFIQEHLEYLLKFIQKEKKGSKLKIKLNGLVNNSTFIQGELLQKILTESYKIPNLPSNAIQRIISLFEAPVGTQVDVTNNIIALRDRYDLAFARDKEIIKIEKSITKIGKFKIGDFSINLEEVQKNQVKISTNNNVEYFDYDKISEVLTIRNWEKGDHFHPIGMLSVVKVSDFLTNRKVSVIDKKNILVMTSDNDIIWILRNRINENYKITDDTTRFLKVELI